MIIITRIWWLRSVVLFCGIFSVATVGQTVSDLASGSSTIAGVADKHGVLGLLSLAVIVMAAWVWWKDLQAMKMLERTIHNVERSNQCLSSMADATRDIARAMSGRPCMMAQHQQADRRGPFDDALSKMPKFDGASGQGGDSSR